MTDSKNRELATSATSKIFEKVNRALSSNDSDRRWFWELLQNAKDTVVHSKGKVDVRVVISKNNDNEPFVRFEHNGGFFKPSNHRFKFDDPKCLLLADSGKIEEDETQREDITGQFGTGFLSTHILSRRILVEGIFFDYEDNYNSFTFELDRRYHTKFDLAQKVEISLDQYDSNFKPIRPPFDQFPTKFTYFLSDNKESIQNGFDVFEQGIRGVDYFIPYVLAFCKEVNSVEIIDELKENNVTLFTRKADLQKQDKLVQIISINKEIRDNKKNLVSESLIEIATCSDMIEHIDVAITIEKSEKTFKIRQIDLDLPVLFSTFPLVGSEKWRFPVMVNSTKFYPRTERDGILLLTGKDNGNQTLIKKSIECYQLLLEYFIENKFQNLYWLAHTSYTVCPTEWTSEDWYKGIFSYMRKFILSKKLVEKENGEYIPLENALFPFTGKNNLNNFWDICYEFIGSSIPKKYDIESWNRIIDNDYTTWQVALKYDIERLLKDIQSYTSISNLAKIKFQENEVVAIDWLNKVIHFILTRLEKPDLLKQYSIVPNQLGKFCPVDNNIHFDVGIASKLKDLLDPFKDESWSFKKILIDSRVIGLENHSPYSTKDISIHINKLIKLLIDGDYLTEEKDSNGIFRSVFYQLISFLTDGHFNDRRHLYDLSVELLPPNFRFKECIVNNLDEFDFSLCNNWICKNLIEIISRVDNGNLDGLQKINEKFEIKSKQDVIRWLDNFTVFIFDFENKKHRENLEKNAIIPNQNNIFCRINMLKKDESIPKDIKDIALSSHVDHDWRNELLHNAMNNTKKLFDESNTITINNIALEINNAIAVYDGNKQNKNFAELIFMMNESETVNDPKYKKLFPFFHSNRDSLIVGTLGDGEALSNVAKLIQNPEKLSILAGLADNNNISKSQLEEFSKVITSDNISISALLDFAKKSTESNRGLISFEGFEVNNEAEESIWKKIALFFIETLREAGINDVNTYIQLLQRVKNNDILVRSDKFISRFVPEEIDKVAYKVQITAIAVERVVSFLTASLKYEILEFDSEYPTIMKVRSQGTEFNIVIRPSNGERYQLHIREREILKDKSSELWLSNGIYVNKETFSTLTHRIFNSGVSFIPLDNFVPGKMLGLSASNM